MSEKFPKILKISIILFALTVSLKTYGGSATWAQPQNGNWSDPSRWTAGGPPNGAGETATVGINAGLSRLTISIDSGVATVGSIVFGTMHSVTLQQTTGSLILDNSGSGATINVSATDINTRYHSISAPISLSDDLQISRPIHGDRLEISGGISGNHNVTINDIGSKANIIFSGNNSYTGITNISVGGVSLQGNGSINSSSSVSISSGANISLLGSSRGGPSSYTFNNLTGSGTLDISLPASNNKPIIIPSGNFSGTIIGSSGKVEKTSAGTLILTGANTYSGGTTVSGGILQGNTTSLQGLITNNATVTFNQTTSGTYAGIMSGSGALIKNGAEALILSGVNTYSGGTTIDAGTLALSGTGSLAPTGAVQLSAGTTFDLTTSTMNQTIGDLTGPATSQILLGPNQLAFGTNNPAAQTFGGIISGSGGIFKQGTGTVDLSGVNTYSGGTMINGGTLALSGAGSLPPTSAVLLSTGTTFDLTTSTIDQTIGDLTGSTASQILLGSNQLTFGTNNPTTQIFEGVMSGSGSIFKQGTGTANLSGVNTYGGTTTVNGGTLSITGQIGGTATNVNANAILDVSGIVASTTTTISNGGLLKGTGTVGTLINSGTVSPGNSIGTITVLGNYTQNPGADLPIEIADDGSSDLLDIIGGTATLAGTLTLTPEPGVYPAGSRFRFMNYDSRTGTLTLIEDSSLEFLIHYQATFAELINASHGSILPIPKRLLHGNPRAIADYLFCRGFFPSNPDLLNVMRSLVKVPADQFAKDLVKLSPAQFGALPLVNLQSHRLISDMIVENTEKLFWCDPCTANKNAKEQCDQDTTSVWIAPIGNYYHQDEINKKPSQDWADRQIAFQAYSVGAGLGASHLFFDCFSVGGAVGYTYSHIDWDKNRGKGHWNSIYLGPSIGWIKNKGYVNLLLLGSYKAYDIDRNIRFPGVNRTASNKHHSYDVLARVDGGYKFRINTGSDLHHFFILPETRVSYLNIFEEGYTESGADSINLAVDSKHSAFLQPTVLVKFLHDFYSPGLCITQAIHAGWTSNIPLSSGNYTSRFYKQSTCQSHFVVKSFHDTSNHMTIGGDLIFRTDSNWIFEIGYKAEVFDHSTVQSGKLKMEKLF